MKAILISFIACLSYVSSTHLFAQTVIDECPPGHKPATVNFSLSVSANTEKCPLLEDKELLKLVKKFAVGTVFAYPKIIGTCLSGTDLSGTVTLSDNTVINVKGFSESAQRLFPEAEAIGDALFISGVTSSDVTPSGIPFSSGAAITVVSLRSVDVPSLKQDLVLSDRFTINFSTFPLIDTEDFLVIGSRGSLSSVSGRLVGSAQIFNMPPDPIQAAPFEIKGDLCFK